MINLQDLVPKVYSNQSRDFQLIERLYDTVLNSVKTNSDLIYSCPLSQNSDSRLMDLISLTLGFSSKHNYNIKQLTALCNAFTYVIKNKGNIEGLRAACNAVISAEGLDQPVEIELSRDNLELTLYIPQDLSDVNLLKDLLTYILPAGMSCNIVKELLITKPTTTIIATTDTITKYYNKEEQEATIIGINTLENISDHFKYTYNSGNTAGSIANNTIAHVGVAMPEELMQNKGTKHWIELSSKVHYGTNWSEAKKIIITVWKQNWEIKTVNSEFIKEFYTPEKDIETALYINNIKQELSKGKSYYEILADDIINKYKNNNILIKTEFNTEIIEYIEI